MPETPDHASTQAAIVALDDARLAAMCRGDLAALAPLLADELTYCHSTGAAESKAQYLDALGSGRVKYIAMGREIARFNAWGACAVMQGSVAVTAEVDGRPLRTRAAFTATWVRLQAQWRMAAWQATPLPSA